MKQLTNEKEILESLEHQAFLIKNRLRQSKPFIKNLNEELPRDIVVVTHKLQTFEPVYFDIKTFDMMNVSPEEYVQNPLASVKRNNFPGNYERSSRITTDHLASEKKDSPVCFIQKVRLFDRPDYEGLFTCVVKIAHSDEVASILIPVNRVAQVSQKMLRILDDTSYMRYHYHKFASLTTREKEIITLLALGYQNNEIGEQLFISRSTVEQHRKNLKRKLNIKRFVDLIRFAQAFDLI
jgi:DNA-binding CsgD family transcriptional regulator